MKNIILIFCIALITGCASPYIPPTEGPTATLKHPISKNSYKLFSGGLSTKTIRFAVAENNKCGKFNSEIKPQPAADFAEVKIPANRKIFIGVGYSIGNSNCFAVGHYDSKENYTYEVKPKFTDKCILTVLGGKNPNNLKPIKLKRAYNDTILGLKVCANDDDL